MMPLQSVLRAFVSSVVLSSALLVAACGGAEKTSNTAAANSNAAANSSAATGGNANASATPAAAAASQPGAAAKKVNLNTASRDEFLAAVPNLGNKMAHEFEEYRPYKSIQQFRKEIGKYVAPDKVAEYERYVFVPVNENESDAETMRQLPGLDATEAAALVAGRPYATREAFLARLSEKLSADELTAARAYLVSR